MTGTITISTQDGELTIPVSGGKLQPTAASEAAVSKIQQLANEPSSVTTDGMTGLYLALTFYCLGVGASWECDPPDLVQPNDSYVVPPSNEGDAP